MIAGLLDKLIEIQQTPVRQSDGGEPAPQWEMLARVWAELVEQRGREFQAAQQVNAETTTLFRIRRREDLDTKMRIEYPIASEKYYDIASIVESDGRAGLLISATAQEPRE